MIKTRINPKTGMAETYDDLSDDAAMLEKVAKTRRELRDMLSGNTQFHTDTLGPTPAASGSLKSLCFCAYLGGECEHCRA